MLLIHCKTCSFKYSSELPKAPLETVIFELFKQYDVINIIPVIAEDERSGHRHVNPRKSQIRNSTPDKE